MVQTTKQPCTRVEQDRAGSGDLIDIFSLGDIKLNAFPRPDEDDPPAYPLTLAYAPQSGLVQLRHSVDPELMFREYWYNSGTNEAMAEHLHEIVMKTNGVHTTLKAGDTVIDIGCNDGTLLKSYADSINRIGYDPAKNIKPEHCDLFINDFFGGKHYDTPKAKIITSIAMFYDVEDPASFAREIRETLTDDGVWVAEMHYLPTMLEHNEVDAICHEHLAYYSLKSLVYILEQARMLVVDVELNDTNGGSMLVWIKKFGSMSEKSIALLNKEVYSPLLDQLIGFAKRVTENKEQLRFVLEQIQNKGQTVWGYGASTKGNTLLQYCEIGQDLIPFIAERNPAKHGRVTVGSRIPIVSEETMRECKPDYLLALPYHFIEGFKKREHAFLERGGKFIVPVPTPQVVA